MADGAQAVEHALAWVMQSTSQPASAATAAVTAATAAALEEVSSMLATRPSTHLQPALTAALPGPAHHQLLPR